MPKRSDNFPLVLAGFVFGFAYLLIPAATSSNSDPATSPQRFPALQRGIYFSVACTALWMWPLHPSMSFLAIICCAASISLVAVVLASPSPMV